MRNRRRRTKHRGIKLGAVILAAVIALFAGGAILRGGLRASQKPSPAAPVAESVSEERRAQTSTPAVAGSIDPATDAEARISVTMLDVGQGLSILIEQNGKYLLYDGGGRSTSSYVVAYLKEHGVTELEYLIASHYDEDHIAGLVGVLNTTEAEIALTPDYTADTKIYESFIEMLDASSAYEEHPAFGSEYALGDAVFQIVSPASYTYEGENDNSIALRLVYGDFSCIMTGDAEAAAEADMVSSGLELESDLYVAGHHGSSSSSSEAFIKKVNPEYVFISVGADNSYGHPSSKTLNILEKYGAKIFRSDISGEVTCFSDGESVWFDKEAWNG